VLLQLVTGNMINLTSEVGSRHPTVFDSASGADHGKSMELAISSVHTGLFIGMNDWKRVLAGGLPGRMSNNTCFQLSAKSPIKLVDLPGVS